MYTSIEKVCIRNGAKSHTFGAILAVCFCSPPFLALLVNSVADNEMLLCHDTKCVVAEGCQSAQIYIGAVGLRTDNKAQVI